MQVYASSTVRRRNTVIKRPRRKQIRGPYFSDFFSVSYNYGYNCSYKKYVKSSFATDVRLPMNIRTTRLVYLVSFML